MLQKRHLDAGDVAKEASLWVIWFTKPLIITECKPVFRKDQLLSQFSESTVSNQGRKISANKCNRSTTVLRRILVKLIEVRSWAEKAASCDVVEPMVSFVAEYTVDVLDAE